MEYIDFTFPLSQISQGQLKGSYIMNEFVLNAIASRVIYSSIAFNARYLSRPISSSLRCFYLEQFINRDLSEYSSLNPFC